MALCMLLDEAPSMASQAMQMMLSALHRSLRGPCPLCQAVQLVITTPAALFATRHISCGVGGRTTSCSLVSAAQQGGVPPHCRCHLGVSDVQQVVAAGTFTAVLLANGTVFTFGSSKSGLGDGATNQTAIPVQVAGLTDVVKIAAGGGSSSDGYGTQTGVLCALMRGGSVKCLGENTYEQLGGSCGSDSCNTVQGAVPGISGVTDISVSAFHVCVRHTNLTVTCWGASRAASCNS